MISHLVFLYLCAICPLAASLQQSLGLGLKADGLPTLTLPYATYRAKEFNPDGDV